ncbi:NAD(P)H-binding protein [Flavobacterium crassostreae]|uniref:NAD(P)H-binding protein n=1 Tax=Flavobacterium crassostreae TaxID=1763534 RepID=UPI0008A3744E|nr:NAD(P)H-binding protein [Flavobacterium crassostreae]
MKTALIIGSTGLVGAALLQNLLNNKAYEKVICFNRATTNIQHPKYSEVIVDFEQPETYQNSIIGDDFFCTIGTTISKAGSKEAFKKVDFEYPKQFATLASKNGINHFLLISSLGADSDSNNFYLKTKGEIEDFLKTTAFKRVSILRPSLLLGDRNEFRFGEKIGGFLMKTFSFLFLGKLKIYKPIQSTTVAKALEQIAQKETSGFQIYNSDKIEEITHS